MFPHRFFEGGRLPESYKDKGLSAVFNTDFRVWLKYEYLQGCTDLSPQEKKHACFQLCLSSHSPGALSDFLVDALLWFHSCADVERMMKIKIHKDEAEFYAKTHPRCTSIFWDFYHVWASFKQQYDIDLYVVGGIHWWEFMRLVAGLKTDTPFRAVQHLREVKENEFIQPEGKAMDRKRKDDWAVLGLDKIYAALPE